MFNFSIISGSTIKRLLDDDLRDCIPCIEAAYLAHHAGETVNPDSYFLRFPKNERNRIIALPASIAGTEGVSGIKWIASFPENVKHDIPRASAVLVLNDLETGYPFSLLEASLISAARTAASAVLGAYWLNKKIRRAGNISFFGAGIIARNIADMFIADNWTFGKIIIYDLDIESSIAFSAYLETHHKIQSEVAQSQTTALGADIVVFATNASTPHIFSPATFTPNQVVLNISLRDIAPELIINANNIFDDVDHCLKANTTPHMAEQLLGNRSFVSGTLAALMRGEIETSSGKPSIFSPFGMGILDLALGKKIHSKAHERGLAVTIPDFFGETTRWGVNAVTAKHSV